MRKIINGKKYDTETARLIAYHENTPYTTDFQYHNQELYLKKTGEFFMYHEYYSSKLIEPFTEDEAKSFCELFCSVEEYEALFGEVEE